MAGGTGGYTPVAAAIVPHADGKTMSAQLPDGGTNGMSSGASSGASGGTSGGGGGGALAAPAAMTVFAAADLSRYCSKFTHILGAGSFGVVCRGTLPDGRGIAVKQVELLPAGKKKAGKKSSPYSGEAGFQLELDVLSRYAHPNLVQLIGYCVEKKKMKKATTCSLVLEFMPGGSLLDRLDPESDDPPLTAQERFDVAADVARGLHYLHTAKPPLIHQDVKTDNILLAVVDGRLVAKVADFGTARIAPQLAMNASALAPGGGGGQTHHSTGVIVGTRPYMAAEYAQVGHVSEKTDTFAYGVVLLELLTGRPPHDEGTGEALHTSAYELLCDPQRRLPDALDARVPLASWASAGGEAGELGGRALCLCLIAKRCLESHPRARGTMREALPKVAALAAADRQ